MRMLHYKKYLNILHYTKHCKKVEKLILKHFFYGAGKAFIKFFFFNFFT